MAQFDEAVRAYVRPRSTEGRLVYAVGDIHGNLDLLEALLIEITRDVVETTPVLRPMLIFVGDYLDRGAASAGVLDLILSLRRRAVFEVRTLKGNHEEAVLTFLADPDFGPTWVQVGGGETLRSYGVSPPDVAADSEAWRAAQAALQAAMPAEHLNFLNSLELIITVGDYVFAHAGVDPHAPLERQVEHDLLWIRGEFLEAKRRPEKVVVHGHTATSEPEMLPYRLGIDTGAYESGTLTAVRLFEGTERLIQVQGEPPLESG